VTKSRWQYQSCHQARDGPRREPYPAPPLHTHTHTQTHSISVCPRFNTAVGIEKWTEAGSSVVSRMVLTLGKAGESKGPKSAPQYLTHTLVTPESTLCHNPSKYFKSGHISCMCYTSVKKFSVVEHWPSMCKAMGSIPSTTRKLKVFSKMFS
jgi:hypothetical protein